MGDPQLNCVVLAERFYARRAADGKVTAPDHGLAVAGWINDAGPRNPARAGVDGIAIAGDGSDAITGTYGIAIAGAGGQAESTAVGAAIVRENGTANAGNGGVAFGRGAGAKLTAGDDGVATCPAYGASKSVAKGRGYATALSGSATAGAHGIASVRLQADVVEAGAGGIAVAWNHVLRFVEVPTDGGGVMLVPVIDDAGTDASQCKAISAGDSGIVISFVDMSDETDPKKKRRVPVVGFVGECEPIIQKGLIAGQPYSLSKEGTFQPIHKPRSPKMRSAQPRSGRSKKDRKD